MDQEKADTELFSSIYQEILSAKDGLKIILQSYFGDVRDSFNEIISLDFDGIGLDFVEGSKNLEILLESGFPKNKILFAGLIHGKNIWRNSYEKSMSILESLTAKVENLVINTSCSLLYVPYSLEGEDLLQEEVKDHFSFAIEKCLELRELSTICENIDPYSDENYIKNVELFKNRRNHIDEKVQEKVKAIKEEDFIRLPEFYEREEIQKKRFQFSLFPTTTIGSFPQTKEVKLNRSHFRTGKIDEEEYNKFNRHRIKECIELQEDIGLDVLVHGEFERNDMVEYFGESLEGYVFTKNAWVQSYGTRCVKPPIIWGDISRRGPITVEWSKFAQSLTEKPVKGMLTGPVTILNWSFPREDISLKESAYQIALAIREEVLDLESAGLKIIQVDEAALREKLPLRKSDWKDEYLDWAIKAFRLVHSGVREETQIHTHMCYSEFVDIIDAIDDMDADVITFEASRSDLDLLDALKEYNFKTEVGPGVYDIHSPRIPSVDEIKNVVYKIIEKIPAERVWINPDCGLKTRHNDEVIPSLKNMVIAANELRKNN